MTPQLPALVSAPLQAAVRMLAEVEDHFMFTRKDNKVILFLIVRLGEVKGLNLLFRYSLA
jgi:hypothetical protein